MHFSSDQLAGFLFRARSCGTRPRVTYSFPSAISVAAPADGHHECPGGVQIRGMLVRRDDGGLELMPLYVAGSLVVAVTGRTYEGGLEEFVRHNDLLARDDQVLVVAEPTVTTGDGRLVVVSGSTAPPVAMIILPVLVVVTILAGGAVLVVRRRRRSAG